MRSYFSKSTIIGFVSGLSIAASSLMSERNEYLDTLIDVLAGLPVVWVRRLNVPPPFYYAAFFLYSGLNGVTLVRLLSRRRRTHK